MLADEWNAFGIVGAERIHAGQFYMKDRFRNKFPTFSTPETKYFFNAIGKMDFIDDEYISKPIHLSTLKHIIDFLNEKECKDIYDVKPYLGEGFLFEEFVKFLESVHSFCTNNKIGMVLFTLFFDH